MITLLQDNNDQDISIHDMMMLDTKANMLEAFDLGGLKISKKAPKEVLASSWDHILHDEPAFIIGHLPEEEQKMLTKLAVMKQEEYITYPRNPEKFLMMQKMYLVVTYEGKDFWHIYMPDSVRKIVSELAEKEMELYPGMREMNNAADRMSALNERMLTLMTNVNVSDKERKSMALGLKTEFDGIIADLKKIGQRKDCSLPVKQFISDMEEQKKLCDMLSEFSAQSSGKKGKNTKPTKQEQEEKLFDNLAMAMAAHKQQEMEDAEKNVGKPVSFSPAITANPPQQMEESEVFCQKLIRPTVIEAVLRLTNVSYMVFYVILQENYIHVACCWDDILDFVWNGVEQPTPWNPYAEVKKYFRKKYPNIASLFGQKESKDGKPLSEPYLTTIGFDHQPKKWWLSMKLYDKTADDFAKWSIYEMTSDDACADILGNLRDACLDIFDEINDSDGKTPKEKMHAYFGVASVPEEEMVDGILESKNRF